MSPRNRKKCVPAAPGFALFICGLLLLPPLYGAGLKPFASDGCSAFPDGTLKQNQLWLSCCTAHDLAYWRGGTYAQRLAADNALRLCVAEVGEPEIAALMLTGVRVGGSPYFPTTFRWGYGWSYPRFYKALDAEELKQIEAISRCEVEDTDAAAACAERVDGSTQ